jgi:hypothetical protein
MTKLSDNISNLFFKIELNSNIYLFNKDMLFFYSKKLIKYNQKQIVI